MTRDVENILPLTPLQHGMLHLALAAPDQGTYLQQYACHLHGPRDAAALVQAWRDAAARHPALRTSIHWEGLKQPVQVIHRQAPARITVHDLHDAAATTHDEQLHRTAEAVAREGLPLDHAPLWRLDLLNWGDGHWGQILTLHHILADGWSLGLLFADLQHCWSHPGAALPPAPSMAGYLADLQRRAASTPPGYWQQRLATTEVALRLPWDGHATVDTTARLYLTGRVEQHLTPAQTDRLRQAARDAGVTLNTLVEASLGLLLARHADQPGARFGVAVADRPHTLAQGEAIFGLLLQVLPVTADLTGKPVLGEWLQQWQRDQAEAREYGALTPRGLQQAAGLAPDSPLFEYLLAFENAPFAIPEPGQGLHFSGGFSFEKTSYPLTFYVFPGDSLHVSLVHDQQRFDQAGAGWALTRWLDLLLALAGTAPSTPLSALTLPRLLPHASTAWQAQPALPAQGTGTLWQRLGAAAAARPRQVALIEANGHPWTLPALFAAARMLAAQLPDVPDRPIAVLCPNGTGRTLAVWTALALARPVLLLDPLHPPAYHAEQCRQAGVGLLLHQGTTTPAGIPACRLQQDGRNWHLLPSPGASRPGDDQGVAAAAFSHCDTRACADQPAVLVFTSGSSGPPKLVPLTHRNLLNRFDWMAHYWPAAADELILLKTAAAFVDVWWESLGALLFGITGVAMDDDAARNPADVAACIRDQAITRLVVTPSFLQALLDQAKPGDLASLTQVSISGEALPAPLAQRLRRLLPDSTLLNLYGASECTADLLWYPLPAAPGHTPPPVGRPLDGTAVAVLDPQDAVLPRGAIGQLAAFGAGVAGTPHLPGEPAFAPHPQGPCVRLGDLGWMAEDGTVHCLGRHDQRLKLRGVRLDPAQVEHALQAVPGIREAAVNVFAAADHDLAEDLLGAWLVAAGNEPPATLLARVRQQLSQQLPTTLRPQRLALCDQLPRTRSGKLDRRALPCPPATTGLDGTPPVDALEHTLAELWADVLQLPVDQLARDRHFYDYGGSSLGLTRLTMQLRQTFSLACPVRAVAADATLAGHAALIRSLQRGQRCAALATQRHLPDELGLADRLPVTTPAQARPLTADTPLLVTGCNGFISAWLLALVLDQQQAPVHCLHPPGEDPRQHLARYGLWNSARARHLRTHPARLERPRWGLSNEVHHQLAEEVGYVLHSGAVADFVADYERLRAPNVLATLEALEFITHGRPKGLSYLTSTAIVDHGRASAGSPPVTETTPLPHWQNLQNAYLQTRWVADHLCQAAMARGWPVQIQRMTTVCGDQLRHQVEPDDMYWRLLRLFAQLGTAPQSNRPLDLLAVDQACRALLALAGDAATAAGIHHLCAPRKWSWPALLALLDEAGCPVTQVAPEHFSALIEKELATGRDDDNLRAVLPTFAEGARDYAHFFSIDGHATAARLARLGVNLTTPSARELAATVDWLLTPAAGPAALPSAPPSSSPQGHQGALP